MNSNNERSTTKIAIATAICLSVVVGAGVLEKALRPQPTPTVLKPTTVSPIVVKVPEKREIINIPVKMSIDDTLTVALPSGEIGTIKWTAIVEYPPNSFRNSQVDSDRIATSNVIQDNISSKMSAQLATEMSAIRKGILLKLPKTIKSIQLMPSKELLSNFSKKKSLSLPISTPTFELN